jgi:hypothetical protein
MTNAACCKPAALLRGTKVVNYETLPDETLPDETLPDAAYRDLGGFC